MNMKKNHGNTIKLRPVSLQHNNGRAAWEKTLEINKGKTHKQLSMWSHVSM